MSTGRHGAWATIRRIAASDRISGLIMLGFALAGLVLANIPATAAGFEHLSHWHVGIPGTNIDMGLGHWAQDGLLTIFFLTVGLELRQELTTGSLSNIRAAAVPMLCAVGGMIVPPILFIGVIAVFSQWGAGDPGSLLIANGSLFPFGETAHGWAIPTATDIAFSLAVLALFAKALPGSIRAFLMTLATVDDLLAIILIAVFFSSLNSWYWFVGIAICAAVWYFLVRMRKVPWFGVAVIGILAWVMMYEAGVHPTLAGVLVGLLTPARSMFGERSPRAERYAVLRAARSADLCVLRHRRAFRCDYADAARLAGRHRHHRGARRRQAVGHHDRGMGVDAPRFAQDAQGAACARHVSGGRGVWHRLHCLVPHRVACLRQR